MGIGLPSHATRTPRPNNIISCVMEMKTPCLAQVKEPAVAVGGPGPTQLLLLAVLTKVVTPDGPC